MILITTILEKIKFKIGIVPCLLIAFTAIICSCYMKPTPEDSVLMRELYGIIPAYQQQHDGNYPPSLAVFGDRYVDLVYVANLQPSDPDKMPILMSRPERGPAGKLLTKDYQSLLIYRNMDEDLLARIFSEPWLIVEYLDTNGIVTEELKQRVSVQMPGQEK